MRLIKILSPLIMELAAGGELVGHFDETSITTKPKQILLDISDSYCGDWITCISNHFALILVLTLGDPVDLTYRRWRPEDLRLRARKKNFTREINDFGHIWYARICGTGSYQQRGSVLQCGYVWPLVLSRYILLLWNFADSEVTTIGRRCWKDQGRKWELMIVGRTSRREAKDFIRSLLDDTTLDRRMDVKAALAHPCVETNAGQLPFWFGTKIPSGGDLKNYYKLYRDWYNNASCRTWVPQTQIEYSLRASV